MSKSIQGSLAEFDHYMTTKLGVTVGKRGKARDTKQLGKIQRAMLVRLLILRDLAKLGKLNGDKKTKLHGERFTVVVSKEEAVSLGVPYGLLRDVPGNVRRTVEGLEDRKLVVSCRSKGKQRTHVKLTPQGTKLARRFYLPGIHSIRKRREDVLKHWELKHGDFQTWPDARKLQFESLIREAQRAEDDHNRAFSGTIGATWTHISAKGIEQL